MAYGIDSVDLIFEEMKEKYGLPVPQAKMTILPFSRWRSALRRMYGSATFVMVSAV